MHIKHFFCLALAMSAAASASATLYSYNFDGANTLNALIPDANPAGYSSAIQVSGIPYISEDQNNIIRNVEVSLNISGGFNGDLYGYLVLQSADNTTTTAILLNRVGRTGADDYGFSTSGLNVILTGDTAGSFQNIHDISSPTTSGTYFADGRTVDPNGDFTSATSTAGLDLFNGRNANGTWTLFLADMSGGDQSQLVSWGLRIDVVPEPTTWALIGFAGIVGVYQLRNLLRKQKLQ